jgi:translation initiation factor 2 alpha subunit (eIF-2alpha)
MISLTKSLWEQIRNKDSHLAGLQRRVEELQASVEGQVVAEQMLRQQLREMEVKVKMAEAERADYLAIAYKQRAGIERAKALLHEQRSGAAQTVLIEASYVGTLPQPHLVAVDCAVNMVRFDPETKREVVTFFARTETPEAATKIARAVLP